LKKKKQRTRLCYFAVFDGHAGSRASSYCAENMHKILADKLSKAFSNKTSLEQTEKEIKRYFVETFRQCDDEFLKIAANK
jgi:integrin-linked kinase-associated serine/threonine phosphatase 2C